MAGGVWVWDDRAWLPWEVLYSGNYSAAQLPADTDLTDAVLPNGVAIRALEPGQVYELGYADGDRLTLGLRFDGVMPPNRSPPPARRSAGPTTSTRSGA